MMLVYEQVVRRRNKTNLWLSSPKSFLLHGKIKLFTILECNKSLNNVHDLVMIQFCERSREMT
jgi:hypothetical protein